MRGKYYIARETMDAKAVVNNLPDLSEEQKISMFRLVVFHMAELERFGIVSPVIRKKNCLAAGLESRLRAFLLTLGLKALQGSPLDSWTTCEGMRVLLNRKTCTLSDDGDPM